MQPDKNHWESIYETKRPSEVSWTQDTPSTSLDFIHSFNLPRTARIIDIGGGDSRLVDFLLDEQFEHITVLDISRAALEKAKQRLGDTTYDCWHDRAAFHFLTTETEINAYLSIARQSITPNGYAIIGTFSEKGPENAVVSPSDNTVNLT